MTKAGAYTRLYIGCGFAVLAVIFSRVADGCIAIAKRLAGIDPADGGKEA